MSFVAVAIGGSALIGAGASIISGNKAAGAQERAAAMSAEVQKYMYDTTREDYAPYRKVGYSALDKLASMYGVGSTTGQNAVGGNYGGFETSPGYQFRVDEATKALMNRASASGSRFSGATMDALQRRVQGVASSEYENFANRLSSLAGIGQSATGSVAQAGADYANAASQTYTNAGNARASAYENTGNAINQGVQGVASAFLYGRGWGNGNVPGVYGPQIWGSTG